MTIGATLGDEPQVFPFTFDVPETFQEVDLHADAADRAEELHAKLREVQFGLTEEELLGLLLTNQRLVEQLIEQDVVYVATFLGRSEFDTTALSTAQFTVAWQQHGNIGPDTKLDELAQTLSERREGCEVEQVCLPTGAALAIIEDDYVKLSRGSFGNEIEEVKQVRQLQVVIPLVDRRELVYFGISTECLQDWGDYIGMMAEICKTIRRSDIQQRSHIKTVLDG